MAVRAIKINQLPDLIRDILDRVGRLERRNRYTVGTGTKAYVLEVNAAGRLVARHATTGTVTVIAMP